MQWFLQSPESFSPHVKIVPEKLLLRLPHVLMVNLCCKSHPNGSLRKESQRDAQSDRCHHPHHRKEPRAVPWPLGADGRWQAGCQMVLVSQDSQETLAQSPTRTENELMALMPWSSRIAGAQGSTQVPSGITESPLPVTKDLKSVLLPQVGAALSLAFTVDHSCRTNHPKLSS